MTSNRVPLEESQTLARLHQEVNRISPRIFTVISKGGGNFLQVSQNGQMWDGLIEFDAYYAKRPDGTYFCKFCKEPELFQSRQELLIRHSWEPMLEWMNNNFTERTWMCLYESDGGSTWVYLKQEDELELERANENFVEAFPVVMGNWKSNHYGCLVTT
ncbi:MAG: hypothetical protein ACOYL3_25410 [Desulfuromonadaceae bacterium]